MYHIDHVVKSYLRSLLDLGVERITVASLLGALGAALDELVVNVSLDERATSGRAALAVVEEKRKVTHFHRTLHCNTQR